MVRTLRSNRTLDMASLKVILGVDLHTYSGVLGLENNANPKLILDTSGNRLAIWHVSRYAKGNGRHSPDVILIIL